MDEQYTQALCNWLATLEAPLEDLPQSQAGGATACRSSVKGVHRQMAPRLAAGCLPTLALDADAATMAGREQEEGREPRDACAAIIPILRVSSESIRV